jgi:hypothetical protein
MSDLYRAKTGFVYELIDPRSKSCKYIGCTFNPEQRRKQHEQITYQGNSEMLRWKDELLRIGMRPEMNILERDIQASELFLREAEWCRRKASDGCSLLNSPKGKIKARDLISRKDAAALMEACNEIREIIFSMVELHPKKFAAKTMDLLLRANDKVLDFKNSLPDPEF